MSKKITKKTIPKKEVKDDENSSDFSLSDEEEEKPKPKPKPKKNELPDNFFITTPKEKEIKTKKQPKKIELTEDEETKLKKEKIIEIILRYHDVFKDDFKINKSFDSYEKCSKKSLNVLNDYLIKFQDKINGFDNSGEKIIEYSLYGVNVYENLVTKLSRGRINLVQPNTVSELLKSNNDYSNVIKQIYCNYFPSFKINNPFTRLGAIMLTTSAVVAQRNKTETNTNNESIMNKIDSLPALPENNNKDRFKEEQKKKDEMFLNEFDKSINKK